MTIQNDFNDLEDLLKKLEDDNLDLNDAIALYHDALKKAKSLTDLLENAEKKLTLLEPQHTTSAIEESQ